MTRSRYLFVDNTNNNFMTEFEMDTLQIKTSTSGNKFNDSKFKFSSDWFSLKIVTTGCEKRITEKRYDKKSLITFQ